MPCPAGFGQEDIPMKQKAGPIAIVIAVVLVILLFAGLYRQYMYQPVYTPQDLRAKMAKDAASLHGGGGPPNSAGNPNAKQ